MQKIVFNSGNRGAFNPLSQGGTPVPTTQQELTTEAIVVDVIVNDDHGEYAQDGYNIGAIRFRTLNSDMFKHEGKLNWAFPLESNITEYPLLNEVVLIHSALNRFYYTRKLNTSSRVTSHAFLGLNEELEPSVSHKQRSDNYRKHTSQVKEGTQKNLLGKKFKEKESVYRLRHDEGDIVFEGRSGQSIKFSASWPTETMWKGKTEQAPNLLMRVGPDPSQLPPLGIFGLVREDINKDLSSIWLVADQTVPLDYATESATNHAKSIHDMPLLDGNQIIINTDRLVLNTKLDKLMGFSKNGIHWGSAVDFTVDADRNYESSITQDRLLTVGRNSMFVVGNIYDMKAGTRASVIAPKVYIGLREGQDEPISCGAMLAGFLERFLDAFLQNSHGIALPTAAPGSPSPLNPKIIAALTKLKTDAAKGPLASFNSTIAYTTKS
jgi:hypothetical protein